MLKELGFYKGVNLGGWMSQCDYSRERLDSFITEEDFAQIARWGFDHVRLPVDYNILQTPAGELLEEGFARVDRAVGLAEQYGLRLVLDLHKTQGFSFDAGEKEDGFFESEKYQEYFYQIWEAFAKRFGSKPETVAFELLNELTEAAYLPAWKRVSTACIRRIRAYAPDTKILIGGYWHNSAAAVKDLPEPFDDNIVYNFHCYEPHIFTHQGAYWMPTMDTSFRISASATFREMAEATRRMLGGALVDFEKYPPQTTLSPAFFEDFLQEAVRTAEARNVPLYCGEYGVIDNAAPEDALVWFRAIHAVFEKYGIGRAAWSYRQMDFGLSDPRMDAVRPELLRCL